MWKYRNKKKGRVNERDVNMGTKKRKQGSREEVMVKKTKEEQRASSLLAVVQGAMFITHCIMYSM